MIFFHLSSTLLSDLYITKNCVFCWYTTAEKQKLFFVSITEPRRIYLNPRFWIKSGYYIVPNPSTTLTKVLIIWWRKEILIGLPSLFIAESKHFFKRQALHWFLCVLSIGHLPLKSPWALQVYTRPLWMLLLKKPEQPEKDIFRGGLLTWHKKMAKSPIRDM